MSKILAKSGIEVSLVEHSIGVQKVGFDILNMLPECIKSNEKWVEVIRVSLLLHDIGKCTSEFQKNLKKNSELFASKNKYRHNEIGWAFCYRYLNISLDILTPILYNIYWHHGISNKMNNDSVGGILNSVSEDDVNIMKTTLIELLGESYLLSKERDIDELIEHKTPLFYYDEKDYSTDWPAEKLMINRTILISSDQLQSKLESNTITSIEDELNRMIYKNKSFNSFICPDGYNSERHENNIEIAKNCLSNTTIINGPGGIGKTDRGVHWNSLSDKKFIIVSPLNFVSQSVYKNIENINENYNLNLTTQLFLTGEIIKTNDKNNNPFYSDITVTNIDNFVRPQVDDKSDNHIERLLMLLFCDVQIDEYHELIMDAALFRLFIILMRMRHRYSESRTLLTSATPLPISQYWDVISKTTLILPEKNGHYPSPHNKKYKISVYNNVPNINELSNHNTLFVFNSIKEAQFYKKYFNISELIHSDFTKKDIDKKLSFLYETYGKQSPRTLTKPNVIGTRIVQTSIDMSFSCLVESICSPQDTFQRIPRINRWGDYKNIICELKFFKARNSDSENKMKNILYTRNLSDCWFNELEKLNGLDLTLDELNKTYNKFNEKYDRPIKDLIKSRYSTSCVSLIKLYPIRFVRRKGKNKIIVAGSNKLRTDGNEIMITAKEYENKRYCDPICQKIYSTIEKDFKEDRTPDVRNKIIRVYKEFIRTNDVRFDVNDILDNDDNITLEELRRQGVKSNTPYVRFDKEYHKEYGLISLSHLDKLLKL